MSAPEITPGQLDLFGQQLPAAIQECGDYEFLYSQIQAGIEHVLDTRGEWQKLTRAELIDRLMLAHRAGLTPKVSAAVVSTGQAALQLIRDRIQREAAS